MMHGFKAVIPVSSQLLELRIFFKIEVLKHLLWFLQYVHMFQIDALMANLAENMARLENKLGTERARQAAVSTSTHFC